MVSEDLVFRAVAHPVRRGILALLATSPRSVKEMTAEFAISQPAVSQHLKNCVRRSWCEPSGWEWSSGTV